MKRIFFLCVCLALSTQMLQAQNSTPFLKLEDSGKQASLFVPGASGSQWRGQSAFPWTPASVKYRGKLAAEVYKKFAASVVVVKLPNSHGTGWLYRQNKQLYIVTNDHVINQAAYDPDKGGQVANVRFGTMKDGWMHLNEKVLPCLVLKTSPEKDLAVLKPMDHEEDFGKATPISLSASIPTPGSNCIAIGHPGSAILWTVRSAQITGQGVWPDSQIGVMMQKMSLNNQDRAQFERSLKSVQKRKVILSNLGVNSGDSGGPLLNEKGELIGVTYAMPRYREGLRVDATSLHVHLDEVRAFLKTIPDKPSIEFNPWPSAFLARLIDQSRNNRPDTLLFFPGKEEPWVAQLIDLDEDSPLSKEFDPEKWDYELAIHRGHDIRIFYDLNNDGTMDLLLIDHDKDGNADVRMTYHLGKDESTSGTWKIAAADGQKVMDLDLFKFKLPHIKGTTQEKGKGQRNKRINKSDF